MTAAPSHLAAYVGYCAVYGPAARTYRSIAEHRKRAVRRRAGAAHPWPAAALAALADSASAAAAVAAVRAVACDLRATDAAIIRRWYRLHHRK